MRSPDYKPALKTYLILIILAIGYVQPLWGQNQELLNAKNCATQFFTQMHQKADGQIPLKSDINSVEIRYRSNVNTGSKVYVIQQEGIGFVVVVQDGFSEKVIGYAPNGNFESEKAPDALKTLLQHFENLSTEIIPTYPIEKKVSIPLLDSAGISLNQYRHEEVGGSWTGCVATAFTQIMAYYKYPAKGKGSYCFNHSTYGQLCADLENSPIDWDNITDDDLKRLSFQVGVVMNMNYNLAGSSPLSPNYTNVLRDFFGYFQHFGSSEYAFICDEIDQKRPVYFELRGNPGHAAVIDGYNDDSYFHINFGWGGSYNGYYLMNTNKTFYVGYTFGTNIASPIFASPKPFAVSKSDSLALLAIHNALNGRTGWNLARPLAEWGGVLISKERVAMLQLYLENSTSGYLAPEIGNLTALETLILSGNIYGTLPSTLSNLTKLKYLSIYNGNGNLSGPLPVNIGNLKNLEFLSLYNVASGIIPPSIGELTQLKFFRLQSGKLSGSLPESVSNLTKLVEINLSDNQLSGKLPENIGNLKELTSLSLVNNQFAGPLPKSIGRLSNLLLLEIQNNQFSGEIPDSLKNWKNIIRIDVSNNQFSGSFPTSIGYLTKIKYLGVRNNQFTSLPVEIGNLTEITELDLSNNALTTLPSSINNFKKLQTLNVSKNKLQTLPDDFGFFEKLTTINLEDNQLSVFPNNLCLIPEIRVIHLKNNRIRSFPPAIDMLSPDIDHLSVENNEISGRIPLSLLSSRMTFLGLAGNRFTYESIPISDNIFHAVGTQRRVPLKTQEIPVVMGDTVVLNIKELTGARLATNEYYWAACQKFGVPKMPRDLPNAKNDSLIRVVITPQTINNRYVCQITNPSAPNWKYIFNNHTYINPCLNSLLTDTIGFRLVSENEKLALQYPDQYVVSSNQLMMKQVEDLTVTLVPPLRSVRGTLQWQASADGKTFHPLSLAMTQTDLRANIKSISAEKLELLPKTPAWYRLALFEDNCNPIFGDTLKVSPFGKVLMDTILNVTQSTVTITVDSISVTIPKNIHNENFRLTIVKGEQPLASPDSITISSVYDVTLSFSDKFQTPLLIKLNNINKNDFSKPEIHKYKAVYFNPSMQQWIPYPDSYVSLADTSMVFETNHLTKLSVGYWNKKFGYDEVYERNNIRVYYKKTDDDLMTFNYGKKQTTQPWHIPGTPKMVQDITQYLFEIRAKFDSVGLPVPENFDVFITQMDNADGVVGVSGMINNYLTIHTLITDPVKLRSVLAHEYMHFTQSKFISPDPGNIFWMEATAHLTDRLVWDDTVIPISESEDYLLNYRIKKDSGSADMFSSLARSWDYWDSGFWTQNLFGNVNYCYLAGTFLHYLRSYSKADNLLDPVKLLKENTRWSGDSWRQYLSNYIAFSMNSLIGDEYDNFVKYVLSGENKKFSLLDPEFPYQYLLKISYSDDESESANNEEIFANRVVYKFAPNDKAPKTEKKTLTIPYLASKMLLLTNQDDKRMVMVHYKRLHEKNRNYKVYYGSYNAREGKMTYLDISDSTAFYFPLAIRQKPEEAQNIAFLLFVNKKSPQSSDASANFNASFELTAMPLVNFADLDYVCVGDGFIHNHTDGYKHPFFITGAGRKMDLQGVNITKFAVNYYSTKTTLLNDSTYRVDVTYGSELRIGNGPNIGESIQIKDITQQIIYTYTTGELSLNQKEKITNKFGPYYDDFLQMQMPEHLSSIANRNIGLKLRNVLIFNPTSDERLFFSTDNTAATRATVVSMSENSHRIFYYSNGEVSGEITNSYVSTDWSEPNIRILLWLHYK